MTASRLVILDRDGVINEESGNHIKSTAEWRPIPGSLAAIARLTQAGCQVMIATNQAGLALGLFSPETLEAIHRRLRESVAALGGRIGGIFYCPHAASEHCRCRKPGTGLFEQIASRLGRDLEGVPVIGDSLGDMLAAEAVRARPLLVLTGNGRQTAAAFELPAATAIHDDLAAAVASLLAV